MRRSGRLFIVLGAVLGIAALLLIIVALTRGGDDDADTDSGQERPTDVQIVRARRDIPAHTKLTPDDVETITVRSDTVSEDEARDVSEVIGFAYREDLISGQRILRSGLEVSGIAAELEPGTRAISLQVDRNNLVAGMIRQDDFIDIILEVRVTMTRIIPTTPLELPENLQLSDVEGTIVPPFGEEPDPEPYPYAGEPGSRFIVLESNAGNPISKVVLQRIRVLRIIQPATGEQQAGSAQSANFLVLEVTPEQAELIKFIGDVGSYQIMLRGPEDEEITTTTGLNMELLVTEYDLPIPRTVRLPAAGAQ
jgi:pilus assembly protein CpaB